MLSRKILYCCMGVCSMIALSNSAECKELVITPSSVEYRASGDVDEAELRRLLPELERKEIRVEHLSKTIQMVNEGRSMKLKVQFQPEDDGKYRVIALVEDYNDSSYAVSVSNTGNDYTGNFRTGISYTNSDLSGVADTLSLNYVTSPNDHNDVHQVSAMYKCVFPNSGDSAYITYSYSDSDMGSIAKIYNLDLYSYGESQNLGVHYQHNLTYKSIRKQIVDFGYDYKKNYGKHMLKYEDTTWATGGYDVEENLLSINYSDMVRNANDAFSYNIGIVHSLDNNQAKCGQYRYGAQDGFNILRAGINYQYRTNSDIIFNARLNGQYTTYNLIPSEQMSYGDISGGRGFIESAISGDKGYKGTLEIYSPEIAEKQRLVLFTDYARLLNNSYNIGESSKKIASWGLGYRLMDLDGFSVSLDYAIPVVKEGVTDSVYRPWHLNIVKTF